MESPVSAIENSKMLSGRVFNGNNENTETIFNYPAKNIFTSLNWLHAKCKRTLRFVCSTWQADNDCWICVASSSAKQWCKQGEQALACVCVRDRQSVGILKSLVRMRSTDVCLLLRSTAKYLSSSHHFSFALNFFFFSSFYLRWNIQCQYLSPSFCRQQKRPYACWLKLHVNEIFYSSHFTSCFAIYSIYFRVENDSRIRWILST